MGGGEKRGAEENIIVKTRCIESLQLFY